MSHFPRMSDITDDVTVCVCCCLQVKCIQDAIKAGKDRFVFQGEDIALQSTVGIFITMNPGYAGRTELPESVKALFRPVVVIVPDLQQICEIMLFSEGFLMAKVSARSRSRSLFVVTIIQSVKVISEL